MEFENVEINLSGASLGMGTVRIEQEQTEPFISGENLAMIGVRRKISIFPDRKPTGTWVVKHFAEKRLIEKEFDTAGEAQKLFDHIKHFELPGRYELVYRPKFEDLVVETRQS